MDITYTTISDRAENILVDGVYWGQRNRPLFWEDEICPSWYICFTPPIFDDLPYLDDERTVGVSVTDAQYDKTIKQLIRLSRSAEVPF